jgi:hypothetical protein
MEVPMDEKTIARFWSKVDKDGPVPAHRPELGPCWIWTAGHFDTGYGSFWMNGKSHGAHCVSLDIALGPSVEGLQSLHRCDVRPCVRPDHLFRGTHDDNMADKVSKGRVFRPQGSIHPLSALTDDAVRAIRRMYGKVPRATLAAEHGVSGDHITAVATGRAWGHLPGTAQSRPLRKLSEADVIAIRTSLRDIPQRRLAFLLGVSQGAVFFARTSRTWKHVRP